MVPVIVPTISTHLVLVTGAASGIGRALCEELLAEGDSLLALDVDEAGLASLTAWAHSRNIADRLDCIRCASDLTLASARAARL